LTAVHDGERVATGLRGVRANQEVWVGNDIRCEKVYRGRKIME
jgi:hypothetical protein